MLAGQKLAYKRHEDKRQARKTMLAKTPLCAENSRNFPFGIQTVFANPDRLDTVLLLLPLSLLLMIPRYAHV